MDPKIHLAVFRDVLDVRNHYLACFSEIFMLRLIPQILRSSEIHLFEGQARLLRRNLDLNSRPEPGGKGGHNVPYARYPEIVRILVRKCQESLAEWYQVVWNATDNFLRF